MAHAAELTAFRIHDYPRFRAALGQHIVFTASSKVFRNLLQKQFSIEADVRSLDPWGQFWLDRDQALMFVLKWS